MTRELIPFFILAIVLTFLPACERRSPAKTTEIGPTAVAPKALHPQPAERIPASHPPAQPETVEAWVDETIDLQAFPQGTDLVVHFNQPMDPESATSPLLITPRIMGDFAWNADFTSVSFTPIGPVQAGVEYHVEVGRYLTSERGEPFQMRPAWTLIREIGPRVHNQKLIDKDIFPKTREIMLPFTESMDRASVEAAVVIEPPVPMAFEWEDNTLIIRLDTAISPGQSYQLSVEKGAVSLAGIPAPNYNWTIKTPDLDVDFERREGHSRLAPFTLAFNYSMDGPSVTEALHINPPFTHRQEWDSSRSILTLVPTAPIPVNSLFSFELDQAVMAASGAGTLASPRTWEYQSPPLLDSFSGKITGDRKAIFTLKTNYAIDVESTAISLHVSPTFDYKIEWNEAGTRLDILAEAPLDALTEYTLRFDDPILDADGYSLPALGTHRYTTPGPLVEKPDEPKADWDTEYSYPVKPEIPLRFVFDRAMDPEKTIAALNISPAVPGAFTWQDDRTLVLVPEAGSLQEYTQYTFTLDISAVDLDGRPVISIPYSWKLRTIGLPNIAGFGEYGDNVQVVDLDGRRSIQIAYRRRPESVFVELYRLSIAQFIEADSNTYQVPWAYDREKTHFDTGRAALQAAYDAPVHTPEDSERAGAEIFLPEDLPPGMYLMNMHTDHLDDSLLVIASRSTLVVKYAGPQGGGNLTAWVSNINGHVMPGTDVRIYDVLGRQLTSGTTDALGVFQTALPEGALPHLVVARRDGDITAAGVSSTWLTRGWYWDAPRRESRNAYAAYLYTDQPIYRPGQTVQFKGIVRRDEDASFRLPGPDFSANLVLRDARGNRVWETPVTLNQFGSFNGSATLAEQAMLGEYSLDLEIGAEKHSLTFPVQDFKKPDIEATVTTDRQQYIAGETISVTVDTRYLFGEPIPMAELAIQRYELIADRYSEIFYYPNKDSYRWYESNKKVLRLETDQDGRAVLTFKAELGSLAPYYRDRDIDIEKTTWGIEVTVDDGSNQHVSAFSTATVYHAAAELSLSIDGYFFPPEEPLPLLARLSSVFSDTIGGRQLTLKVEKYGGSYWKLDEYDRFELETAPDGTAPTTLTLPQGHYLLTLSGKDSLGNEMETRRHIYVYDFRGGWSPGDSQELAMIAHENTYRPGETAEIIVESNFDGEGLLTIERGGVLSYRIVRIEAPFTTIRVPVLPEYAPNVYVLLQAWQPQDTDLANIEHIYSSIPDSALRWDAVELIVPDEAHRLNVSVIPDQETYGPRDEAGFTIEVTDSNGRPVQAELSIALVDEALFLLAEDPAGHIHESFFEKRSLSVYAYDSMAPWRYLWTPDRGGGGGGDELFGSFAGPRADFPDSVLWLPEVATGPNGEAHVTIKLPDTLTAWRLTAKAVTRDTLIGEGTARIQTQQDVVIRPLPPRSLTAGDQFILSALVHNFGDRTQTFFVDILVEGLQLEEEAATRQVRLEPGGSGVVNWAATAGEGGTAAFAIRAKPFLGKGDAIRMEVHIQPLAVSKFSHQAGSFTGSTELAVQWEPGAGPGSLLRVAVDATMAGDLLRGVEFLTGFPYGCVEQTMSKALPNAVVARAFEHLGLQDRYAVLGLDGKLDAGVQRLYAFQHADGGWGWWHDDPSDFYQTAWVVFGLSVTADSGHPVDPDVIKHGAFFLKENLELMNPNTRAFALYALARAGRGDPEWLEQALSESYGLDPFSRGALALAFQVSGETETGKQILDEVLAGMLVEPDGDVYAPTDSRDGYYRRKYMSSRVRSTALVLQAVVAMDPENPLRAGMVQWLQGQRRHSGWGTTNETAFTLLALTDHFLSQRSEVQDAAVSIFLNGDLVESTQLDAAAGGITLDIPAEKISAGLNLLRLESDADAPLYFLVSSRMQIGQQSLPAEGIRVTRQYLDPQTKMQVEQVKEGDLVLVRLRVTMPEAGFYMMLTDRLPGGLEALNERLNTSGHDGLAPWEGYRPPSIYRHQDLGYNNKEIWADRVLFFITAMEKGTHQFEYLARATVAGDFTALPAEITAMYDEALWGRSGSAVLAVGQDIPAAADSAGSADKDGASSK